MEFFSQQKQKAKTDKMRDQNIELLRAFACISVVVLHINAWCFQMENLDVTFRYISAIVNTLVRFAVPCFMMITGTYVFRNADKHGWKVFYKRIVKKVIAPTLCFSAVCVAYVVLKGLLDKEWVLKDALTKWLRGIPFGHMWYMYMLMGFYLAVPFLGLIRQNISKSIWGIIGILCLLLSFLFYNENLIAPIWPLCWIQYVGYFIVGDFAGGGRKSSKVLFTAIAVCTVSIMLMCNYTLKEASAGVRYDFQPQNILTACFSISVYFIFRNLRRGCLPVLLKRIAGQSANIYYLHGVVVSVIVIVMNRLMVQYKYPVVFLIVSTVVVTFFCYYIGTLIDRCVRTIMISKEI